jgi:hypothetical protein
MTSSRPDSVARCAVIADVRVLFARRQPVRTGSAGLDVHREHALRSGAGENAHGAHSVGRADGLSGRPRNSSHARAARPSQSPRLAPCSPRAHMSMDDGSLAMSARNAMPTHKGTATLSCDAQRAVGVSNHTATVVRARRTSCESCPWNASGQMTGASGRCSADLHRAGARGRVRAWPRIRASSPCQRRDPGVHDHEGALLARRFAHRLCTRNQCAKQSNADGGSAARTEAGGRAGDHSLQRSQLGRHGRRAGPQKKYRGAFTDVHIDARKHVLAEGSKGARCELCVSLSSRSSCQRPSAYLPPRCHERPAAIAHLGGEEGVEKADDRLYAERVQRFGGQLADQRRGGARGDHAAHRRHVRQEPVLQSAATRAPSVGQAHGTCTPGPPAVTDKGGRIEGAVQQRNEAFEHCRPVQGCAGRLHARRVRRELARTTACSAGRTAVWAIPGHVGSMRRCSVSGGTAPPDARRGSEATESSSAASALAAGNGSFA